MIIIIIIIIIVIIIIIIIIIIMIIIIMIWRGKPDYPEKNLSEQMREPTTNSTHTWRQRWDLNPGHIRVRRALPPLRHPLLPGIIIFFVFEFFNPLQFD